METESPLILLRPGGAFVVIFLVQQLDVSSLATSTLLSKSYNKTVSSPDVSILYVGSAGIPHTRHPLATWIN